MKAKAINDTWARDCDKYYFIVKLISNNKNQNASLNVSKDALDVYNRLPILNNLDYKIENYIHLTKKVFSSFKSIFKHHDNYDWYLKADDDTFVFVEHLRKFLSNKNKDAPVTYGLHFKRYVENGYLQGGAGYVLSNLAMRRIGYKLIRNEEFCFDGGTEDIDVAECLEKLESRIGESRDEVGRERFHIYTPRSHLVGDLPSWIETFSKNPIKKVKTLF